MGVRSHIGVQNVQKIPFGADKGRSHKTSRSLIRGLSSQGPLYNDFKKFFERIKQQEVLFVFRMHSYTEFLCDSDYKISL